MGDTTVHFFAPSYGIHSEHKKQHISRLCQELCDIILDESYIVESFNEATCADNRTSDHQHTAYSWSQGDHTSILDQLLASDILWAVRGGYGSINWAADLLLRQHTCTTPPYLIGYSDISIWHALWQRNNWGESCYGLMPGTAYGQRGLESLRKCIDGAAWSMDARTYPDVIASAGHTSVSGTLHAYCLRVLTTLCGTPFMPTLDNCILAIEDIDERPYSVDRDLTQLFHAGCLSHIRALICGEFPCAEQSPLAHRALFAQWGARLGIPVLYNLPFGHNPDPLCLPDGRTCTLHVDTTTTSDTNSHHEWALHIAARTP